MPFPVIQIANSDIKTSDHILIRWENAAGSFSVFYPMSKADTVLEQDQHHSSKITFKLFTVQVHCLGDGEH